MTKAVKELKSGSVYRIERFDGGLNMKTSPFLIRNDEAVGLQNFNFDTRGDLLVRKGYVKLNETEITEASGIYGMFRFYKQNESDKYFIVTTGTSIYLWDSTNLEFDELTCDVTLTSDQRFRFAVMNDLLFLTNGANKPLKWLGGSSNNIKQIGLVAPTNTASTSASESGGKLEAGTYYYKLTYYNSTTGELVESSATTAFPTAGESITGSTGKITVSDIPQSDDPQADKIRLYRTKADGSVYYLVTTLDDGTTSYADDDDDDTIGANSTLISNVGEADTDDHDPPPTDAEFILAFKNILFLYNNSSHKSRLYYSLSDEPEYFPSTNYRDINKDDGDVGTGVIVFNDMLYLFKENSTWVLTDPADPTYSDLRNVSMDFGCISPESLKTGQFKRPIDETTDDEVYVPGIIMNTRFGIMGFDGTTFWPLSERVDSLIRDLYKDNVKEMVGFFNDSKYYIAYTPKLGSRKYGGFVTTLQFTTDSGDEQKDATYSTNHDPSSYSSTYDARIDLSNTAATNEPIKINVYIDWYDDWLKEEKAGYKFQYPEYEIFFSYDNGGTWTSKGRFREKMKLVPRITYNYSHLFYEKRGVTNVRLDYYSDYQENPLLTYSNVDFIRLESVEYFYEYSASVTGSNVVNNKMLYYDTLKNAWSEYTNIRANCFCAWNGAGDDQEEFFGSSNTGYVYYMNSGYMDDAEQPIVAIYESKHFDAENNMRDKRFQQLNFSTETAEAELHIDVFIDKIQVNHFKFELNPPQGKEQYWDEEHWGDLVYDRAISIIKKSTRLRSRSLGRYISFRMWITTRAPAAIRNYNFKYALRESMR